MLLEKVTHEVRAILWISENPLSSDLKFFNELDYLFDGLLSHHLKLRTETTDYEKNIFSGRSFNRDLLLIQLYGKDKQKLEKDLEQSLALIPGRTEHPHVLVCGEQAKNFNLNTYKKKFDLRFDLL